MSPRSSFASLLLLAGAAVPALGANTTRCSPEGITVPGLPSIFGAQILSVSAESITSFRNQTGNDVCFVTVSTTHPGTGDRLNNFVALPLSGWTGVFQGIGGGGYRAGDIDQAAAQTINGYSTAWTDAGLGDSNESDASPWALLSTGNINQTALLNFARRSLHDMTTIGKAVSHSFYGQAPKHSYWNGCSTGGRQGLTMAQYYPEDYDGILADAPAIQWNDFTPAQQWPYTVQNNEGYAPSPCEFSAVRRAVIDACDHLDGLVDGIISAPALCAFQAQSLVGKPFTCDTDGSTQTFSQQLATVMDKIWQGARTPDGQFLWYGHIKGANLTESVAPNLPNVSAAQPFLISDSWFKGFLAKDLSFNTADVSYAEFADLFLQGHIQYDSIIGDASPDLRPFKARGGKMITWQGLADGIINPQGTMLYHQKVQALDPAISDFYRMFFSPGIGHCSGGTGVTPTDAIGQLRAWVENGTAPAYLEAASEYPVNATESYVTNGTEARHLNLCPYPQVNQYSGSGNVALASSWRCANGTGWESFAGPSWRNYSCVGGPGWYGSAFETVDVA